MCPNFGLRVQRDCNGCYLTEPSCPPSQLSPTTPALSKVGRRIVPIKYAALRSPIPGARLGVSRLHSPAAPLSFSPRRDRACTTSERLGNDRDVSVIEALGIPKHARPTAVTRSSWHANATFSFFFFNLFYHFVSVVAFVR